MDCEQVKNLIADFLNGNLDDALRKDLETHLSGCGACRREADVYQAAWNLLGEWPDEEPERFYLSHFWERLATDRPWYAPYLDAVRAIWADKKAVSVLASVCGLVIAGLLTFRMSVQINRTEMLLTALSAEEIEFVQNLELAENFELLEQMDLFQAMDGLGRTLHARGRDDVS